MRKILAAAAIATAIVLGGCAGPNKFFPTGFGVITQTIKNPVGKRELASVELTYQITAKAFVACAKAHCTSRANLAAYKKYDQIAYASIVAARPVVRNNPNISGLSAVLAARQAVSDFQAAVTGAR